MKRLGSYAILLALIAPFPLHAAESPEKQLPPDALFIKSIERLSELPGFRCQFEQQMVFSDGGSQHYSGEVAMLKPKRFRWSYRQPYEQLYVGDGSVIWHYEPDLMQAERLNDLEQVDPAVMKLLDGRVSMKDIVLLDKQQDEAVRRYMVSILDSKSVWLGFNSSGELISIERQDLLGNSNRMRLSTCSYVAPSPKLFIFTPPEGVDLVDLRTANSE